MDRRASFLPLTLVALLAGGALIPHLSTTSGLAPSTAQPQEEKPAGPAPVRDSDDAVPFVDLMSEMLNVDVSEQGLIAETRRRMLTDSMAPTTAEMVRCFLDLNLHFDPALSALFNGKTRTAEETWPPCGDIAGYQERFAVGRPPDLRGIEPIVNAALAVSKAREAIAGESVAGSIGNAVSSLPTATKSSADQLKVDTGAAATKRMALLTVAEAARAAHVDIDFVIATVPDPIDSYAGWQFDPTVATLQEAASWNHYSLATFYFPDYQRGAPATGVRGAGHSHEAIPATVLFRGEDKKILVLLLPYETPTSGIHTRALSSAFRLVGDWGRIAPAVGRPAPIRVLGPTFSGATRSLRETIERIAPAIGGRHVRIVSGSASAVDQTLLSFMIPAAKLPPGSGGDVSVTFRATLQRSEDQVASLWSYLKRIEPGIDHQRVVWLTESNTGFGQSSVLTLPQGIHCDRKTSLPGCAVVVPFPLHISRIRPEDTPAPPSRFKPLNLADENTPTDQLPVLFPNTTGSYVEQLLASTLRWIRDSRAGYVGIIATDARDKMFLARAVRRDAPNVVLFTTTTDVLYSHPDYYTSTGGMLIASPYEPLGEADTHFASSTMQGVHNALTALLSYSEDGEPINRSKEAPLLRGYDGTQPRVWISVVGRQKSRAVAVLSPPPSEYPFRLQEQAAEGQLVEVRTGPRIGVVVLATILCVHLLASALVLFPASRASAVAWSLVGRRASAPRGHTPHWLTVLKSGRPEIVAYVFVSSTALLLPATLLTTLAWTWGTANGQGVIAAGAVTAFAGALAILAGLCIVASLALVRCGKRFTVHSWPLVAAAACGAMLVCLAIFVWPQLEADAARLFAERIANWSDGVSPVVPVMALSLAFYVWAAIEVGRLLCAAPIGREEQEYIDALLDRTGTAVIKAGLGSLQESILQLDAPQRWVVAAVVALVPLIAFDPVFAPLRTVDDLSFGRLISTGVVIIEWMIAVALCQFLSCWFRLHYLLTRISALPLSDALKAIPYSLFPTGARPRLPRAYDLEYAVHLAAAVAKKADFKARHESQDIESQFQADLNEPNRTYSCSRTWPILLAAARDVSGHVWADWKLPRRRTAAATEHAAPSIAGAFSLMASAVNSLKVDPHERGADRRAATADLLDRQKLLTVPLVYIVRGVLVRMWDNVLFVGAAIALLAFSMWGYRVQMQQALEAVIWIDVLAAVCVVLYVFVGIERDEFLSHVTDTDVGTITWDRDFVLKLLVYGLLPLASLFATQYPDLSGTIARWVEPMQKALP
jgi:hypothetical protein